MPIQKCYVIGCKNPETHTTWHHRCSECNFKGHGKVECSIPDAKRYLQCRRCDTLPEEKWCSVPNCPSKETHCSELHECHFCSGLHQEKDCQEYNINISDLNKTHLDCPHCKTPVTISEDNLDKVYIPGDYKCWICVGTATNIRLPCGHLICEDCIPMLKKPSPNREITTQIPDYVRDFANMRFRDFEGKIYVKYKFDSMYMWFIRRDSVSSQMEAILIDYLRIMEIKLFTYGYKNKNIDYLN